jgi:hypothetical protein
MHIGTSTLVAVLAPTNPESTPPSSFIEAVRATSRFRIHGAILELLDQNGVVLARLAATKSN